MDRGRVTQPRDEYRVNTELLAKFFSIKVDFLLESGNKSLYE